MRRTGTGVRGRRFAAVMAVAAVAVGAAAGPASGADSIRAQQWYLDAMHAPDMWKTSTGQGITVAVIDSGVNAAHPDLAGQVLPGKDFTKAGNTSDSTGHGTGMASIIAGTGKGLGGKGAYGLAPGAKILPIKVNDAYGGKVEAENSDLAQLGEAIVYASDQGAKVINLSVGIPASNLKPVDLQKFKTSVDHARARGSLLFAAVGNSGNTTNRVEYPGASPGVVGVAATDKDGKATAESEHGPQVSLAAPGADMYHACTGPSGYCKANGTSDATAVASASAALLWAAHPDWTNNQVLRVLINTASSPKERSDFIGYGAVRPRIALTEPGDPGPAGEFPLKTAAAAEPSQGAGTGGASAPATAQGQEPASSQPAAAPSSDSDSDPIDQVQLILGAVVIAAVLLVIVFAVLAKRKKVAAARAPVAPPAPYGAQPPYQAQTPGFPAQQPPAGPYAQQPPAPGGFPPPQGQTPPPPGGNPYAR
ncbi:type VII secretion-associated serine protease mycosin [Kitasatospora sp. NPDC051914]|uniref:type VII secretion-associated serine protease mycosin n=1 Tax=Kitasatospora sp. NPDC051914 TaxID=3154945 RepID=UPI00343B2C08